MAMPRARASESRQHDAHRHALGDIVERHGQHHHRRAGKPAPRALGLAGISVQMRDDMIQQEQEADPQPKSRRRRRKGPASQIRRLLHGGDQQAPDRGGHHDAGRKAAERLLHALAERLPHEEDASCAERGAEKGNQQTDPYRFHPRPNQPFFSTGADSTPRQV